jgi:hypothetical protein
MAILVNQLNANDYAIVGLEDSSDPSAAVRRDFVTKQVTLMMERMLALDAKLISLTGGQNIKAPCVLAISDHFNLNSGGSPTLQGVTVTQNTRVLLTNQMNPRENGIYLARSGAWIRSYDANNPSDFVFGFVVEVTDGEEAKKGRWMLTTIEPVNLDETPLTFAKQSNTTAPQPRGVTPISDGGTGGTTPEAARKNLGVAEEVVFTPLGDGINQVFVIPHGLNNAGVLEPSVIDLTTNKYVQPSSRILDANNIEVSFGRPPAANSITVTIVGIRR